jgi:MarR family transcriptional regulator, organic hydroperoxide resistance regulator
MEKADLIKAIIEKQRIVKGYLGQEDPGAWLEVSLTIAQIKSMFFIANESSVNFRTLAKALKVTPSNVTGIIDRLVEQQLVSRKENPEDRRMSMLQLTAKGTKLISGLREMRDTQMLKVLKNLSEDELNTIMKGYTSMAKAVNDYTEKE